MEDNGLYVRRNLIVPANALSTRPVHKVAFGTFRNRANACYSRSPCVLPNLYTLTSGRYGEEDMGNLRRVDRRREPRTEADLALTVWGVDTKGDRFLQEARARDFSLSGALLSGLDAELRSGDLIGILYAGKKARYRIVWVRESENGLKVQAAVQRIAPDECPWKEMLEEEKAGDAPTVSSAAP